MAHAVVPDDLPVLRMAPLVVAGARFVLRSASVRPSKNLRQLLNEQAFGYVSEPGENRAPRVGEKDAYSALRDDVARIELRRHVMHRDACLRLVVQKRPLDRIAAAILWQ